MTRTRRALVRTGGAVGKAHYPLPVSHPLGCERKHIIHNSWMMCFRSPESLHGARDQLQRFAIASLKCKNFRRYVRRCVSFQTSRLPRVRICVHETFGDTQGRNMQGTPEELER